MLTVKDRQGVAVWLYSMRQVRQLRRYGTVMYTTKKLKYALLYVDGNEAEATVDKLKHLRFVKDAEVSHRPELDLTFSGALGDPNARRYEDEFPPNEHGYEEETQHEGR